MHGTEWRGRSVALTVDDVSKSFSARRVLRSLTVKVVSGETLAVTGSNGSGKSTLLKVAAGLIRPTKGSVSLTVGDEVRTDLVTRREWIAYAGPDMMFYPELSGRENLTFFAKMRGKSDAAGTVDEAVDAVGLGGRGDDPVSAYSSGMKQRLRLAFALGADAPVLLLDEPSLALDDAGVALVAKIVRDQRARGGLTVLATNDAREAALGDRTIALSQ